MFIFSNENSQSFLMNFDAVWNVSCIVASV